MFSPHTKTQNTRTQNTHNKAQKFTAKLLMIAALPVAFISQSAIAAPYDSAPTITVSYQDLNLTNKQGQKRLATRINSAVKKVCSINQARNLNERIAAKQCQSQATKKAYRQMENVIAQNNAKIKLANNRIYIVGN